MYSQKGSPSKNLSGTGIFSRCPLWSFLPTARCKQKNSQSKGLYLSKNNTRLSHWRGLALSPQPKERRGDSQNPKMIDTSLDDRLIDSLQPSPHPHLYTNRL